MRGEPLIAQGPQRRMQNARPAWTVDLRAVGGQTGSAGAPAVMSDARPAKAVVVLGWGVNDVIQHTDVAPMRALIEKTRAEGSRPVLTGPVPYAGDVPGWLVVTAAIRAMASDTATPSADWSAVPIVTIDTVHPDQASSNRLVDKLIPVIDAECEKAAQAAS